MTTSNMIKAISELQASIHDGNVQAGWWADLTTNQDLTKECKQQTRFGKAIVAEKLCLIHSEVSEAMEGARKNLMDDKIKHRKMIEVELADAVIRILDLCGALELDIANAIAEKLNYNLTRPDHQIKNRKGANGKQF